MITFLSKFARFGRRPRRASQRPGRHRIISAVDFRHQVYRERMRASRRETPFCVLKLTLANSSRRPDVMRELITLVQRHVRATDDKGRIGRCVLGLILADTPEMGGRCVLDRLEGLSLRAGFEVSMELRCYDPAAFVREDDEDLDGGGPAVELARRDRSAVSAGEGRIRRVDSPLVPGGVEAISAQDVLKRAVDILGALVGIVLVAPVLAAAAIAVRWSSPGPAIFVQMREGRGGRPFRIYKLRTMYIDAEARQAALRELSERDGPAFKIKDDPRVTPVGRFLRSTCIDELPQLWNILRGEMSLVGPRPLPIAESRACATWHRRRLDVRPGLTCNWQINKHSVGTFDEWMRLDLAYVDAPSLVGDLRLIARTLTVPLAGRGSD